MSLILLTSGLILHQQHQNWLPPPLDPILKHSYVNGCTHAFFLCKCDKCHRWENCEIFLCCQSLRSIRQAEGNGNKKKFKTSYYLGELGPFLSQEEQPEWWNRHLPINRVYAVCLHQITGNIYAKLPSSHRQSLPMKLPSRKSHSSHSGKNRDDDGHKSWFHFGWPISRLLLQTNDTHFHKSVRFNFLCSWRWWWLLVDCSFRRRYFLQWWLDSTRQK